MTELAGEVEGVQIICRAAVQFRRVGFRIREEGVRLIVMLDGDSLAKADAHRLPVLETLQDFFGSFLSQAQAQHLRGQGRLGGRTMIRGTSEHKAIFGNRQSRHGGRKKRKCLMGGGLGYRELEVKMGGREEGGSASAGKGGGS